MTDLLWLLFGLLGAGGLGITCTYLIFGFRLPVSGDLSAGFLVRNAEAIGLACVLGLSVTSYLQFIWSFAGGRLGPLCSFTLAAGGLILGAIACWKSRFRSLPAPPQSGMSRPKSRPEGTRLAQSGAWLVCLIFSVAVIQALLTPQKFWDERAYYGLKAIVLFEDRTIYSPDLAEPDFIQGHPKYPLLISLAEQHLYVLLGRADDRLSKIIFPVLFFGLVMTVAGVLSRNLSTKLAWLGALLLATMPVLMPDDYGFICGQADAPVACLEGLAILYLWDALARRDSAENWLAELFPCLLLGGMFSGLTGFTKDEGISYCLLHFVAGAGALMFGSLKRRTFLAEGYPAHPRQRLLIMPFVLSWTVIPGLVLGPWLWHRRHLPLTGEMNYFGRLSGDSLWTGLETWTWTVPHLAYRMFAEGFVWGLQWWLLLAMAVLFPHRALRIPQVFLLLNLAGALAALLVAGMVAPITLHEHIGGSSHRYLMQIAPTALLFSLGQFVDEFRQREPASAGA